MQQKNFNMYVGLALTSFQEEDEQLQLQPQVVLLTAYRLRVVSSCFLLFLT